MLYNLYFFEKNIYIVYIFLERIIKKIYLSHIIEFLNNGIFK